MADHDANPVGGQQTTLTFRHRSARMAGAVRSDRLARHPAALDAPIPHSETGSLSDVLAESDSYAAWIGQPVDRGAALDQQLDLDRVLTTLPAELIPLCAVLMADEPNPAEMAGLSRTTMHRRVQDLRCRLLAAGIGVALEQSDPAVGI